MKINDMFPSNYLKKEDVPHPVLLVINSVEMEEIQGDGGKESKPILKFAGGHKPMVLNRGNGETISAIYGDDSAAWHGKSIEVYVDPSVQFAGKRVGGLRVRMPSANGHAPTPAPAGSAITAPGGWMVSDGKTVHKFGSKEEVRRAMLELIDMNIPLASHRVKGPDGIMLDGEKWMLEHAGTQPKEDPVPF